MPTSVPYHKIKQAIYGDPSPITVGYTASTTTFELHNPIGEAWTVTDNQTWLSCSPDSGTDTQKTITITYITNTNTSPRSGAITLTSSSGASFEITINQIANPGVDVKSIVVNHGLTDVQKCNSDNQVVRYIPTAQSWATASQLYSNSGGTVFALAGWYSDGSRWRRWSGAAFTETGFC